MSNAITDLIDYFQTEADDLDNVFNKNKRFTNADAGDLRENALLDFLSHHIPSRTRISKGGYLFDSNGNKSKQIDLLVTNNLTLQFSQSSELSRKIFNCIEGCVAAVSVKTNLDKNSFYDSLDNLASIPLEKKFIRTNANISNYESLLYKVPQKIIFAYKGQGLEKTINDLQEYYKNNKLDERQKLDLLIVNNEYALARIAEGTKSMLSGKELPAGSYTKWSKINTGSIGGLSLFRLLVFVQKAGNVFENLDLDMDAYYEQINLMDPLRTDLTNSSIEKNKPNNV